MKVIEEGGRLKAIGKRLRPDAVNAESIGLLSFRQHGGSLFRQAVEEAMCEPSGVRSWYLSVIDGLAARADVRVVSIEGMPWAEVDFPHDIAAAELNKDATKIDTAEKAAAAQAAGQLAAAVSYYQRALALRPEWEEGWRNLGTLYYVSARYADAVVALKNAVALNARRGHPTPG